MVSLYNKVNCSFLLQERVEELGELNTFQAINPIPAGVLENQDMLGGATWPPPSKSHVLCPNMTNNTSLESYRALLLESAKKLQICKNWIFYSKIQLYSKNVSKINLSKKWKIIHFWKALDHAISNMQKVMPNFE